MLDKDMVMHIANATAGRYWMNEAHVQAFANAIAQYEREECAKVCENLYYGLRIQPTRSECADAIRSRK